MMVPSVELLWIAKEIWCSCT